MDDEYYLAKGTLQTCPYTAEPTIIESIGSDINKSQCRYSDICSITPCPLEQELKLF